MFPPNRLRVIRAERRISQLRLALAARIHPTRLWRIENGLVDPTEAERGAILQALAVAAGRVWPKRSSGPSQPASAGGGARP